MGQGRIPPPGSLRQAELDKFRGIGLAPVVIRHQQEPQPVFISPGGNTFEIVILSSITRPDNFVQRAVGSEIRIQIALIDDLKNIGPRVS